MRRPQALQVVVRVAHRNLRLARRPRYPGKRPGNVLPCRNAMAPARGPVEGRVLSNSVSGKPLDAPCAGAVQGALLQVFSGGTGGNLPCPAPRQAARAGVRFSFAGRSAVLRRGRCEPAFLREATKDAVAVPSLTANAACLATWAGGLLFGVDVVADLRLRHAGGCLPRPRDRLGRRDGPGLDQGLCSVPSCPASLPKVSRGRRTAASGCHLPLILSRPGPSVSIRPVARPFERVAQSVPAGASPRTIPECTTIPEVAPGRRQPQATAAAPAPDSRRPPVFPVCRSALQRRHNTAASEPLECTAGTEAAPEQNA